MLTYFRCVQGKIERRSGFSAADLSDYPEARHWIDLEEVFHFHLVASGGLLFYFKRRGWI